MDLSRITITCFAASYAVTLVLEVTRLWWQAAVRNVVMLGFAVAGLLAHSIHLGVLALHEARGRGGVFASWYDWLLLSAWVLAAAYIGLALRRPRNTVGLFILPVTLIALGMAYVSRDLPPFPRDQAVDVWRMVHGMALLLGTVAVLLGGATGVMYLVQSYRLKHKLPPRPGLRLPSLEWLQRFNRETLWISTASLAIGLLAGIVLNLTRHGHHVLWNDSVVISSGVLFLWLVLVTLFESLYKPARQGRKVAYLTLASFVFLALALLMVLLGGHARAQMAKDEGPLPIPLHPRGAIQDETPTAWSAPRVHVGEDL